MVTGIFDADHDFQRRYWSAHNVLVTGTISEISFDSLEGMPGAPMGAV